MKKLTCAKGLFTVLSTGPGLDKPYCRYGYHRNMMFEEAELQRLSKCPRSYGQKGRDRSYNLFYFSVNVVNCIDFQIFKLTLDFCNKPHFSLDISSI